MADVFISYSRRDLEFVGRLAGGLQARGKDVFVDLAELWRNQDSSSESDSKPAAAAEREQAEIRGIPPSAPWMDEIRTAIAEADPVVVVISPDLARSPVCALEIAQAIDLHKRIVPVVIGDTPPERVSAEIRELNWLSQVPSAPTGKRWATGDDAGQVVFWSSLSLNGGLSQFSQTLCPEVRTNLTRAQWAQDVPNEAFRKICPGYP